MSRKEIEEPASRRMVTITSPEVTRDNTTTKTVTNPQTWTPGETSDMIGKETQLTCLNSNQREESSTARENRTMPPHSLLLGTNPMKQVEALVEGLKKETSPEEKHHKEIIILGTNEVSKSPRMAKASLTHFYAKSATKRGMTAFSTIPNSQSLFQEEVM